MFDGVFQGRRFIRDKKHERMWCLTYRTLRDIPEPFTEYELQRDNFVNKLKERDFNVRVEYREHEDIGTWAHSPHCCCYYIVLDFDNDADEAEFIVRMSCE